MNNLYHKVAVASVYTTLGFILGTSLEAKAASFTFAPTTIFSVMDTDLDDHRFDGVGDVVFPDIFNMVLRSRIGEVGAFAEFNIGSFSLAPNTIITSAILQTEIYSFDRLGRLDGDRFDPGRLSILGYIGNGTPDSSDFQTALVLSSLDISSSSPGDILSFDVSPFFQKRVSNGDTFAGFGIRASDLGLVILGGGSSPNFFGSQPRLIVETTERVPEPTTIFGSVIGLTVGGWLKRKKSSE